MPSSDVFNQSYSKLNKAQKEAVDTLEGPVMVVAGPGTGKTQLLSLRIANILKTEDINPENILVLTFTDSASTNMKKRLHSIIGSPSFKVQIDTFHSFGTQVINEYPEYFFGGASFRALDEIAKTTILEKILAGLDLKDPLASFHPTSGWIYKNEIETKIKNLKEEGLNFQEFRQILETNKETLMGLNEVLKENFPAKISKANQTQIFQLINLLLEKTNFYLQKETDQTDFGIKTHSLAKAIQDELLELQNQLSEADFSTKPFTSWKEQNLVKLEENLYSFKDWVNLEKMFSLARIYQLYEQELQNQGFFDFEDMLLEVIKVLENNDFLRLNLQEKYQYIMVDEFQDTNGVQLRLLENLLVPASIDYEPNILVVGDDDQAVYKFQKASIENILGFRQKYAKIKYITLTQNYRSTQEILDFAKNLIENAQTRLTTELGIKKDLVANKG
jgi:DNA helicase-2/ATP-dependent DNA helicase PcrA